MEKRQAIIEQKQRMLTDFYESGQSIQQFCKERNLSYSNFFYWKKKLGNRKKVESAAFLEVPTTVVSAGIPQAEVIYSNGNRIALYSLPDVLLLKQLAQ